MRCAIVLSLAVASTFSLVFALIVRFLAEAIEASFALSDWLGNSDGEGVLTLVVINATLLGWLSVAVVEHGLGRTGAWLFIWAAPCCTAAVIGGISFGAMWLGRFPEHIGFVGGVAVIFCLVSSGIRAWYSNFE